MAVLCAFRAGISVRGAEQIRLAADVTIAAPAAGQKKLVKDLDDDQLSIPILHVVATD